MILLKWFRNQSLNIKLLLILLSALIIIVVLALVLVVSSFDRFALAVGQQEAQTEVNFLRVRFDELTQELLFAATQFGHDENVVEAIADTNIQRLQVLSLTAAGSIGADDVDIVDTEGARLLAEGDTDFGFVSETEGRLINLALLGSDVTGVVVEEADEGEGAEVEIRLAAGAPVITPQGERIGALVVSNTFDAPFLDNANFGRQGDHIALIYEGEVFAASPVENDAYDILTLPGLLDGAVIDAALRGQVTISDRITYTDNGVPQIYAHMPLEVGGRTDAVLVTAVDMQPFFRLRDTILQTLLVSLVVLASLTIVILVGALRQTVVQPILNMEQVVQKMTAGDYGQRLPVDSRDEVGQLTDGFNQMAQAVQDRIRETEAALERARHSDQVKSAFLASMSHELRTPLNATINFTRFVLDGDTGPINEQQADLLTEVVNSSRHLLNLINDVLDMSKIESGSLNLFVEDNIDLKVIVDSVVRTGQSLIKDKPITLHTQLDASLPLITGDRQRILQILLNIMSNACKFTEQGEIQVQAAANPDEIIISIKDTGPGIAPEDQPDIFEAFRQTKTGLRQGGGTGLGMPIAKNLAEAHGGRLWVQSGPGQGATFFVALPVKSAILELTTA